MPPGKSKPSAPKPAASNKGEGAQAASSQKTNAQKMATIRETQRETAKIVKPKAATRAGGPGAKITNEKYAKAVKKYVTDPGKDFKGVGSNFYTPPKIKTGKGKTDDGKSDLPKEVVSSAVETVVPTSGLVDGVNYKDLYLAEISRLVLSLVHNAKSLLIRYNFSGIDRVPEYYLDSDRESKSQAVASTTSRPQSPFSLTEANLQDQFSTDINEINNKISDLTDNSVRSEYFGTMRGGTFLPREVKIFADGRTGYDMRLTFTSVSNQDFIIKCYEVS